MNYLKLYIEIIYTNKGIIASKECKERQTYEFSEDITYYESSFDALKCDLDKIIDLMRRNITTTVQVGRYEVSTSNSSYKNSEKQRFYFESVTAGARATINDAFNEFECKDTIISFRNMKNWILDFFKSGLNFTTEV